jgi:hypothetical protein
VQPDDVAGEVHEEQSDMRVLGDVAQARHHAVAPVLRPGQPLVVEYAYEAGRPGAERVVALTMRVGRRDEHHLLVGDELAHLLVQVVEHLLRVEALGPLAGPVPLLQLMFASRARPGVGAVHDAPRVGVQDGPRTHVSHDHTCTPWHIKTEIA